MRKFITPGRLYSKLSHEYHQVACPECASSALPPPCLVPHGRGNFTWTLEPFSRDCARCEATMAKIVNRYQAIYDLFDPISPMLAAQREAQLHGQRRAQH